MANGNVVWGLNFSNQLKSDVVADIISCHIGDVFDSRLVITPNMDHIVTLHENEEYRKACEYAWKLTVDGFPVKVFLDMVGASVPERVTGADMFPEIMAALDPNNHKPCFLVATRHTADFLENYLKSKGFCDNGFIIVVPRFGFENDDVFSLNLLSKIKEFGGTHLFMGVGAPKSEIWAYRYREQLSSICILCFGAGIEFFSNNLKRAPKWMQRVGMEWLWRLLSEPRRLAKRYLLNSWKFFGYAIKEFLYQKECRKTTKSISQNIEVLVDYSFMGRRITGLERISADLFSPDALSNYRVFHTPPQSAFGMIKSQWFDMVIAGFKNQRALMLFPGFPPSIIVSFLFSGRVVPYIHDLFLIERTADLNVRAKLYMRPSFKYAVRNLRYFFVNSLVTASKLRSVSRQDAKVMLLRPKAVNVFHFDKIFRALPEKIEALKICMLGTIEPRKNYRFAAELTRKISNGIRRPVELHIVGRVGWGEDTNALFSQSHVFFHGYLASNKIRELVNSSHFYMSTSLDEGLGLPILEMLFSGIPMIISDIPTFREVASSAPVIFIPNDDLDVACERVIAEINENLFESSIEKSQTTIAHWNALAEKDMLAFDSFVRNNTSRI